MTIRKSRYSFESLANLPISHTAIDAMDWIASGKISLRKALKMMAMLHGRRHAFEGYRWAITYYKPRVL